MNWKTIKIIFSVLIGLCLVVFIAMTDLSQVAVQIEDFGFSFIWLIVLSFGAFVMGSVAWKFCFENHSKVSVKTLFFVRTIGETITLINPTNIVAGEASKVVLLHQNNISKREKIDSILISRIILISSQLVLTLLCLLYLSSQFHFLGSALLVLVALVFFISLLMKMMHFKVSKPRKIYTGKLWRSVRYISIQGSRFTKRFSSFLKNRKKQLGIAFLYSTVHWLFGAGELFVILNALQIDPLFIKAITADMGVVIVKSIGGFVPAQIGVEEFGNKYMLTLIGVTGPGIWVSVSILRRAKQLFWIMVSAFFYLCIEIILPTKNHKHGSIIYHS